MDLLIDMCILIPVRISILRLRELHTISYAMQLPIIVILNFDM